MRQRIGKWSGRKHTEVFQDQVFENPSFHYAL
jgi:hypothetical protein